LVLSDSDRRESIVESTSDKIFTQTVVLAQLRAAAAGRAHTGCPPCDRTPAERSRGAAPSGWWATAVHWAAATSNGAGAATSPGGGDAAASGAAYSIRGKCDLEMDRIG
jgi:hypothetical protein